MLPKVYLGDGVYVVGEYGRLKLTTENGTEVTNTIYLEHWVYEALCRYVELVTEPEGAEGSEHATD